MSRRGNCWDNAPQESFFGHMKDDINYKNCSTFTELHSMIDDYMDYYNNYRLQVVISVFLFLNIKNTERNYSFPPTLIIEPKYIIYDNTSH